MTALFTLRHALFCSHNVMDMNDGNANIPYGTVVTNQQRSQLSNDSSDVSGFNSRVRTIDTLSDDNSVTESNEVRTMKTSTGSMRGNLRSLMNILICNKEKLM
jgi:hypothetical protein